MAGPMDLNAPPSEDDEELPNNVQAAAAVEESGVEIMRRERAERMEKMRRQREESGTTENHRPSKTARTSLEVPVSRPVERFPERSRALDMLPEGWVDCPPTGSPIERIIPSKVPLGESMNELVGAGKRYSWKHVAQQQRTARRELGLVIDLTNTTRYYNTIELSKQGIRHIKIACRGRNEVPDNESVNKFVFEATRFRETKAKNGNVFMMVHCTHGFNRTGFMIVHFLVRKFGMSVDQAVQRFAEARPPGIYKRDYIESLFTFYNEPKSESLFCPSTPEWKKPADVDLNGDAKNVEDDDDGVDDLGILAALQEDAQENSSMTIDDILGDAIHPDQEMDLQKTCLSCLGVAPTGRKIIFPGSQPVSLDRKHLQLLRQRYYYATWKADGTRYMMLLTHDGCYLIDRKFQFRRVQMRFPRKGTFPRDVPTPTQHLTLLDGEMVIDKHPETGIQDRRYLVYDLMVLNGQSLVKKPFSARWMAIEKEVIEPRKQDAACNRRYDYEAEAAHGFRVRRKDFWPLSATTKLLNVFIPKLPHEADGLIFQGWDDQYVSHTHSGLLKWKYAHMNSVDFLLKDVPNYHQQGLHLVERGKLRLLDGAKVKFPEDLDPLTFEGKIIECSWDPNNHVWEFMRVRIDKDHPNAWGTYEKVVDSIKDNITEAVLLAEIQEIIRLPMYQERIPVDQVQLAQAGRRR